MTKCIDCGQDIYFASTRCKSCSKKTHGYSKTRLYIIWNGMKGRCDDPLNASYRFYGAIGVTYCEEWKNFLIFREWALHNQYSDFLSLDRKDSSKGYFPENCRWVTDDVQYTNRKIMSNNTSGYKGVGQEQGKDGWYARIALKGKRKRLGWFTSAKEAAIAYNTYIIKNNLPHNLNEIL